MYLTICSIDQASGVGAEVKHVILQLPSICDIFNLPVSIHIVHMVGPLVIMYGDKKNSNPSKKHFSIYVVLHKLCSVV